MQHGLEGILHIGKKFINYEERDDKVIAFFEDGSSVEGDLLIGTFFLPLLLVLLFIIIIFKKGADGANSKVRMQLLPHADRVRTGVITIICKTRYFSFYNPFLYLYYYTILLYYIPLFLFTLFIFY